MTHRALVAYRRPDGAFDLRYAHWGTRVGDAIGPATPLGGPADRRVDADRPSQADRRTDDGQRDADFPAPTRVSPVPLATGADADRVLRAVDPALESLVVVSPRFETATYLVVSLDPLAGLPPDERRTGGDQRGRGGPVDDAADLVLARPHGDPVALRRWCVDRKSALSAAVAAGALSPGAARAALRTGLAARADVHPPDDASFLRGD